MWPTWARFDCSSTMRRIAWPRTGDTADADVSVATEGMCGAECYARRRLVVNDVLLPPAANPFRRQTL